jgi:hypothetical protein
MVTFEEQHAARSKGGKTTGRRDRQRGYGHANSDRRAGRSVTAKIRQDTKRASGSKGKGQGVAQEAKVRNCPHCGFGEMEKRMSSVRTKQEEVDRNFAFFQAELPRILPAYRDKYALIRDKKIENYFDTFVDAHTAGSQLFKDDLFSIQQVTEKSVDLGFFSHAMHLGNP